MIVLPTNKTTIEVYGKKTLKEVFTENYPDVADNRIDAAIVFTRDLFISRNEDEKCRYSNDFIIFAIKYIYDNIPLEDCISKYGISKLAASAWASDVIGTVDVELGKLLECLNDQVEDNTSDDEENLLTKIPEEREEKNNEEDRNMSSNKGFDIYKYADEFDADYYEMGTGRIYHVQDYNRARKYGLPTNGIAVTENGVLIGYCEKAD